MVLVWYCILWITEIKSKYHLHSGNFSLLSSWQAFHINAYGKTWVHHKTLNRLLVLLFSKHWSTSYFVGFLFFHTQLFLHHLLRKCFLGWGMGRYLWGWGPVLFGRSRKLAAVHLFHPFLLHILQNENALTCYIGKWGFSISAGCSLLVVALSLFYNHPICQ